MIVGIDEVGRGPWAGPLVVGATVLADGHNIVGLTDSKLLSAKKRLELEVIIRQKSASYGLGWVTAQEVDKVGLSKALELGCIRALKQINVPYHQIIIDGTVNLLRDTGKGPFVTTLKKADLLISSVSAAAILAKVARDRWMQEQHVLYPEYGFDTNVGYGTAKHTKALNEFGITPIHRLSFAPVAKVAGSILKSAKPLDTKSSRAVGNYSESVAARELVRLGYEILDMNWKTKWCEVDIIAAKTQTLYFVEVKHRKNEKAGGGMAAITAKKLKQMTFAARLYQQKFKVKQDMRLVAMSTTGSPPKFEELVLID